MNKLALALGAVLLATASRGSAADGPTFSSLPSGKVAPPPKGKAPGRIGAGEKVPGFFLTLQHREVVTVSTRKMAKHRFEGLGENPAGEACFTQSLQQPEGDPSWDPTVQPMLSIMARGSGAVVTAVHSERISDDGGRLSLETVDAWVDPVTRGARLIGRGRMALQPLSTSLGGGRLYAARDGDAVHFVFVEAKDRQHMSSLFVTANDEISAASGCEHLRATLKTEKGQGRTATFVSAVELPSLDASDAPELSAVLLGGSGAKQVRVRPVHVQASVSWTHRETEPLVTVSSGWESREQTAFAFTK